MQPDIARVDDTRPINTKYAICSALPTGRFSKLLIRDNYPADLTIENIQTKYDERFDDISYYTIGNSALIGG